MRTLLGVGCGLLLAMATGRSAQAFPITFDATALSAPTFAIDGGAANFTVTTLDLAAGTHSFAAGGRPSYST